MANTQKYKLTKGSHSRLEDGNRVLKDEGEIFVPTDRELESFPWKFEPVLDESDEKTGKEDNTGDDGTGSDGDDKGGSGEENKKTEDNDDENNPGAGEDNDNTPDTTDITELNTRDAGPVISECNDKEQLETWLSQEQGGENRSTIIKALESRINAVEEGE